MVAAEPRLSPHSAHHIASALAPQPALVLCSGGVCTDTKGGRRAVTAQALLAMWLGTVECATMH